MATTNGQPGQEALLIFKTAGKAMQRDIINTCSTFEQIIAEVMNVYKSMDQELIGPDRSAPSQVQRSTNGVFNDNTKTLMFNDLKLSLLDDNKEIDINKTVSLIIIDVHELITRAIGAKTTIRDLDNDCMKTIIAKLNIRNARNLATALNQSLIGTHHHDSYEKIVVPLLKKIASTSATIEIDSTLYDSSADDNSADDSNSDAGMKYDGYIWASPAYHNAYVVIKGNATNRDVANRDYLLAMEYPIFRKLEYLMSRMQIYPDILFQQFQRFPDWDIHSKNDEEAVIVTFVNTYIEGWCKEKTAPKSYYDISAYIIIKNYQNIRKTNGEKKEKQTVRDMIATLCYQRLSTTPEEFFSRQYERNFAKNPNWPVMFKDKNGNDLKLDLCQFKNCGILEDYSKLKGPFYTFANQYEIFADKACKQQGGVPKVLVLGRRRNIVMKGRVKYVMYHGVLHKLSELRKMEKRNR